ncbi:MAG TPA: LacI family transcriptional regulator [Firmicutes bacterium]|nr:LacI family transcriptional regulator [Bacillota bacterium]
MPRKATIFDVAKRADVPVDLVEKIIRGEADVEHEVQLKVLRAVHELHYHPEFYEERSNSIALMAPFFYAPFVSEIVDGIEKSLVGTEFNAGQYSTKGVLENERHIFEKLIRWNLADAFVLFNIPVDDDVREELKQLKTPVVSIESEIPGFTCITTDNYSGGYKGTEYLLRGGRKNIAIVIGRRYNMDPVQNDRIKGYMQALTDNGLEFQDDAIFVVNEHVLDEGREIFYSINKAEPAFDAVFCMAGDVVATGIISAAKKAKVKIPDDLAIIGYDDLAMSGFLDPPLTTIKQPARKMGEAAIKIITEGLRQGEYKNPGKIIFESELIVRSIA